MQTSVDHVGWAPMARDLMTVAGILDDLPYPAWLCAVDTERSYPWVAANRAMLDALGAEASDLVGRPLAEVIPDPDAAAVMTERRDDVAGSCSPIKYELVIRHPSGLRRYNTTLVPIRDDGGECSHIFGVWHDATRQRERKLELERRAEVESLISAVSRNLGTVRSEDLDPAVVEVLEQVAGFVGAAAARLLRVDGDTGRAVCTHEWRSERMGPTGLTDAGPAQPVLDALASGRDYVFAADLADVPEVFAEGKRRLEELGARSIARIAMRSRNRVIGFIALIWLDEGAAAHEPVFPALAVLGDVLEAAIERKEADAALRDSEERFRVLVQSTSDIISIMRADGTVDFVSPAVTTVLGWSNSPRRGPFDPLEFVHPEDRGRVLDSYREAVDGRPVEYRMLHADGSWRHMESVGANRLDDPAIRGVVVTTRDVSERKAAEEARNRHAGAEHLVSEVSRRLLTATEDDIDDVVAGVLGQAAGFLGAAGAALQRYSADGSRTTRTHLWTTPRAEHFRRLPVERPTLPWIANALRDVDHLVVDVDELPPRAGALVDGLRTLGLLPVRSGGRLTGYVAFSWFGEVPADLEAVLPTLRVLADVVVAAIDRTGTEQELHRNEERFRALVQNSSDMITVLDADGVVVYTSPASLRVLALDADEQTGALALDRVHPDDLEDVAEVFQTALEQPGPSEPVRLRLRHADGSWRTIEAVGTNLLDDPAVRGLVVNGRDVTERVRLEEQLLQAQKMEAVGQLAGGVAHDFNNLLTAITGYTALLLEEIPDGDSKHTDLEEIDRAAQRAAELVDQLLAFSRRKMTQPTVLDISEVVDTMRSLLRRLLTPEIDLELWLGDSLPGIRADRAQVEQVLMNMVVNARDAMPEGGPLVIETTAVHRDELSGPDEPDVEPGEYVCLSVSDAGTGMDAATRARVFEPFFTTKDVGQGTGLGLSTVYGIVSEAGGHVHVYSELGHGTTFRMYFPALAKTYREDAAEEHHDGSSRWSGCERVLVVDDEPAVRALAAHVLRQRGYEVLEASDGDEAVRAAEAHPAPIDLVLTDVVLPGMRGVAVAERLTATRPGLRVLYTSGYTEAAIVKGGELTEGVAFLPKPFRPDDLARRVREVLDGVDARRG